MIVNESDKPKADHDIATNNQTKIPAIVEAPFSDTEKQTVGSFDSERAGRSRRARSRESSAGPAGQRTERSKSAPGEKRVKTTRPKSRRREQGTEVKLCPLRLNTTEGALKKEARFNSRGLLGIAIGDGFKPHYPTPRLSGVIRTAPKSRAT